MGLHETHFGLVHKLAHVCQGGGELNDAGLLLIVGGPFLFQHGKCHRHKVMELEETCHEQTSKLLDRVVRVLLDVREVQVPLSTVTLDQEQEQRNLLVREIRVHQPADETARKVIGRLEALH